MRYLIAVAIAGTIIGTASLYANHVRKSFLQRIQQEVDKLKQSGELPKDADFTDFGTELPSAELMQIKIVDLWITFRVFLIPLILIGSLAVARMLAPQASRPPFDPVPPTQT